MYRAHVQNILQSFSFHLFPSGMKLNIINGLITLVDNFNFNLLFQVYNSVKCVFQVNFIETWSFSNLISFLLQLESVENLWQKGFCASLYEGSWILKSWKCSYSMSVIKFISTGPYFSLILTYVVPIYVDDFLLKRLKISQGTPKMLLEQFKRKS